MTTPTQTIFLTGATGGLGLECAVTLGRTAPMNLVLGVRDAARGESARRRILNGATPGTAVSTLALDLDDLQSVRAAAATLGAGPPLDAVVCNAGVHETGPATFTSAGLERTFGVNHVAHQVLVSRLWRTLAPRARVVVVTSGTHDAATLEGRYNPPARPIAGRLARGLDDDTGRALSAVRRYTTSKLCNVLFARELARRSAAAGRPLTVTAFDPGAVPGTDLTRSWSLAMRLMVKSSWALKVFGVAVSTPPRAGAAMARRALESEPGAVLRYFQLDLARSPAGITEDRALAAALFDDTLALVDEPDPFVDVTASS